MGYIVPKAPPAKCTCTYAGDSRCALIKLEIQQLDRDKTEWDALSLEEKIAEGYQPITMTQIIESDYGNVVE